jgi:hypothetical protein
MMKPVHHLLILTTLILTVTTTWAPITQAAPIKAIISPAGAVRLEQNGKEIATLLPGLFEAEWQSASMADGRTNTNYIPGMHQSRIVSPTGIEVDVELRVSEASGELKLNYRITPRQNIVLNSLHVGLQLPSAQWAGGKYSSDKEEGELPIQFNKTMLRFGALNSLNLTSREGALLQFGFAESPNVLIQDDRQWGKTFSVRIGQQPANAETWPAGKAMRLSFTLRSDLGLVAEEDSPITIVADDQWLPLEPSLDVVPGSALDFSAVIPRHMPAGKLGHVIVNGDGKFAFSSQPERAARFYGINLCFSSQYLEPEVADQLAERLWRSGYNALRIHHYEGELIDRKDPQQLRLNPAKLQQLDYLFAAMKKRGIYVTTDLFVSRPVAKAVIYPGEKGDMAMDDYKMAVPVNERAYEDYKQFARLLLEHVNPYTGMRYADDPALAWLSLINENCPGNFIANLEGPLRDDWQKAWNRWLVNRYADRKSLLATFKDLPESSDPAKGNVPFQNVYDQSALAIQFNVFLAETEKDFFERTRRFLRDDLQCRALLTDMNAWTNPVQMQAVRHSFDYVDDHFYVDHPEFLEKPWSLPSSCPNTNPLAEGAPGGRNCAFTRLYGKPFTITEYNYSSPGRFRGVGGILTGTLGGIQDWDGIWRFSYAHNRENVSRPAALNYFDVSADPLNQAAERASLCLFLRGDITPASHFASLDSSTDHLLKSPSTSRDKTPAWNGVAWLTRVGWNINSDRAPDEGIALSLGNKQLPAFGEATGASLVSAMRSQNILASNNSTDLAQNRFQSENEQVTIDAPANRLILDTERTAGGFAPAGSRIQTRSATINIVETDATVWISSLDNRPISTSKRLLITHLTDLQNTNARYGDRAKKALLDWGHLPHLMQAGRATVTVPLANVAKAKVYGLATDGKRRSVIAAAVKGGSLIIPLTVRDKEQARMLYEVVISD